jgi:hypothetical protein
LVQAQSVSRQRPFAADRGEVWPVECPHHQKTGAFGLPAFSYTATGEERHFCCTLDRCELGPASRTVSPRSGKDPSSLRDPSRVLLSLARPLHSNSYQASGLCFASPLCCSVFLMYTPNTLSMYIRSPDMSILSSASLALPGRGDALFHGAMNFALTEFDGVHPVSKRSHLVYKLAHLT